MRYLIFLLFFQLTSIFAQQTIELCPGDSKTVRYYSEAVGPGVNIWSVNGVTYTNNDLIYTFNVPGIYNIVLRRENGPCFAEQTYQVVITECPSVIYWVPNAFTPDKDEYNQQFGPVIGEGVDVYGFIFEIYNRWGEVLFVSNDPNGRWDGTFRGKPVQDGIYTWKLLFNTYNDDGKVIDYGHLTLIR